MAETSLKETPIAIDDLVHRVRDSSLSVYAVLDACDEPLVPAKANILGDRAVSLYRGRAEQEYWAIAPYLVWADEATLGWIVDTLWQDPWGIFVVADADLETLRKHLRRFLMVRIPSGDQVYFRFCDPRPLPVFLQTCTETQLDQFFGPIHSFVGQRADDGQLVEYARDRTSAQPLPPFQFFKVGQPQLDALAAYMEQSFLRRCARFLQRRCPGQTASWSDEKRMLFADDKLHQARSHRIEYEADIQRYIGLCAQYPAMRHEPQPKWILEILRYPNRPAERKLDILEDTLKRVEPAAETP